MRDPAQVARILEARAQKIPFKIIARRENIDPQTVKNVLACLRHKARRKQARALNLFRVGLDTAHIAGKLRMTEAEAYNALHHAREAARHA